MIGGCSLYAGMGNVTYSHYNYNTSMLFQSTLRQLPGYLHRHWTTYEKVSSRP